VSTAEGLTEQTLVKFQFTSLRKGMNPGCSTEVIEYKENFTNQLHLRRLQIRVQRMLLRTININLVHNWECNTFAKRIVSLDVAIKLPCRKNRQYGLNVTELLDEFLNLRRSPWLLASKLIAGKRNHSKSVAELLL
jgi:hypothetical protein